MGQKSADAQLFCRDLSGAPRHELVADLNALSEVRISSSFNRRDMDEHVRSAFVWLNEAIPLGCVEPLHRPHSHFAILLKQKKQLNERDSSVDLAANRRQKAVADWSRRRLSVISVNVLLPPQSFSMFCQPHPGPLPQSALLQQAVDCRLDDLP